MDVVRTEDEINALEDWCFEAEEEGTNYHGMTYEQGIRDAIDWLRDADVEGPHE